MLQKITSSQNLKFKNWKNLLQSKHLKQSGLCILSGEKLIRELLGDLEIEAELLTSEMHQISHAPAYELPQGLFNELDVLGTHFNLLIVKQTDLKEWNPQSKGLQILCPLGDPLNLGALIRNSEAFGVNEVVLLKESAHPFLPKAIKSSSGSVFRQKLSLGPSIKEISGPLHILDMDGHDIRNYSWPKTIKLLVGEEGAGIPKNLTATKISIPLKGQIESLNATMAIGIALYEISKNR